MPLSGTLSGMPQGPPPGSVSPADWELANCDAAGRPRQQYPGTPPRVPPAAPDCQLNAAGPHTAHPDAEPHTSGGSNRPRADWRPLRVPNNTDEAGCAAKVDSLSKQGYG